ncbi:thioester reductase domain-containing protein [Amycolatopsis keratiniphila]|uniref:Thioester reductase (TE) domain-containing protein n=1 Tax=Amycolatopsis keratiniphila subsp. keratiniphila TaxID=227715 RepID=A0A1W2M462_9PSEU|nr:thioester reductase domain-containing protein [Amycolatopsis keratiniphila]ONF75001.1 hypothetical protein AVR91_0200315 [Amycolatopsis keratiniphila subsp. keratiniphila]
MTAGNSDITDADVLLTGATGFIGAFLLAELLTSTPSRVHCVVRAASRVAVIDRLRQAQAVYGLDEPDWDRIEAVPGDLTARNLGLDQRRFAALAQQVTTVFHAAAHVNLVLPARMLDAVNVEGTRTILRLAGNRGATVHFLSTSEVFGHADGSVDEDTVPQGRFAPTSGYGQSKRAGELLVLQAHRDGLPVVVHRLDRIAGDSRTGACQPRGDDFWLLVRTALDSGVLPEASVNVTPVDFAARAVLALAATAPPAGWPITHIHHPCPVPMTDIAAVLGSAGRPTKVLPVPEWSAALEELGDRPGSDPVMRLLPVIASRVLGGNPQFLAPRTEALLRGMGLQCPTVDTATVDRYVAHLRSTGFLSAPTSTISA